MTHTLKYMAGILCAEVGEQQTIESESAAWVLQSTPVVDTLYLQHVAVFNFHNFPDLKHMKVDCFSSHLATYFI